MANKWLSHVKKTMKMMKKKGTYKKGMGLSQVIKEAKKTWHKRGGAEPEDKDTMADAASVDTGMDSTMEAGRRRRKTRRHSRKH